MPACGRQTTSFEHSIFFHPSPSVYCPVANQWKQAWAQWVAPAPRIVPPPTCTTSPSHFGDSRSFSTSCSTLQPGPHSLGILDRRPETKSRRHSRQHACRRHSGRIHTFDFLTHRQIRGRIDAHTLGELQQTRLRLLREKRQIAYDGRFVSRSPVRGHLHRNLGSDLWVDRARPRADLQGQPNFAQGESERWHATTNLSFRPGVNKQSAKSSARTSKTTRNSDKWRATALISKWLLTWANE